MEKGVGRRSTIDLTIIIMTVVVVKSMRPTIEESAITRVKF